MESIVSTYFVFWIKVHSKAQEIYLCFYNLVLQNTDRVQALIGAKTSKLQIVLNNAACLITGSKRQNILLPK